VKSQGAPLKAEAVTPAQSGGPALPLESVDRALAGGQTAAASGAATVGGKTAGSTTGAAADRPAGGSGDVSREGVSILWEDPAQGREPTSMPKPEIPAWVSNAGLTLTVEVSFVLTPQGVMQSVRVVKEKDSSGYTDVDTSVLQALRRWKFKPVSGRTNVNGRVRYLILPR
jgi:TonB family protein